MTAIDTSGIDMIRELKKMLDKRSLQVKFSFHCFSREDPFFVFGVPKNNYVLVLICGFDLYYQLVLANPGGTVMEKLQQSNALEAFGCNGVYLTVGEAIGDISSLYKAQVQAQA